MAVIVGVVVIVPVIVAALGNGNDTVGVIDAVQRSELDELGQHRHDPLEQLGGAADAMAEPRAIRQFRVAIGQMTTHAMRQDEEFARALVHVELLEVEHARLSTTSVCGCVVVHGAATVPGAITITATPTITATAGHQLPLACT